MTRRSGRGVAASLRGVPSARANTGHSDCVPGFGVALTDAGSLGDQRLVGDPPHGRELRPRCGEHQRIAALAALVPPGLIRRAEAGLSLRSARVSVVGEPWRHLNHADRGGPPPALDGFHRAGASDTSPSLLALCQEAFVRRRPGLDGCKPRRSTCPGGGATGGRDRLACRDSCACSWPEAGVVVCRSQVKRPTLMATGGQQSGHRCDAIGRGLAPRIGAGPHLSSGPDGSIIDSLRLTSRAGWSGGLGRRSASALGGAARCGKILAQIASASVVAARSCASKTFPRCRRDSVSDATPPSPSRSARGMPGLMSLAVSPTATLTKSSDVTAATMEQWRAPASSSVARSSPRPIRTGIPAFAPVARTEHRYFALGRPWRRRVHAAPARGESQPVRSRRARRGHGRGRRGGR